MSANFFSLRFPSKRFKRVTLRLKCSRQTDDFIKWAWLINWVLVHGGSKSIWKEIMAISNIFPPRNIDSRT